MGIDRLATSLDLCGDDVPLCRRVITLLGKLRTTRATKALIDHLEFVVTRNETVNALASIEDPESIPALIHCLETDAYVPVRAAAAQALGRMGGARAWQALKLAGQREKDEMVLAAVRASLATRGGRR